MAIRYLAEISKRTDFDPRTAQVYTYRGRVPHVYFIGTGAPEGSTCWTDWGGNYDDVPATPQINPFFGQFLQRVENFDELEATDFSYLINGSNLVIRIDRYPWLYEEEDAEADEIISFASAPQGAEQNYFYHDALGNRLTVPVRLMVPKLPNKLSDPIRGATLKQQFNFSLINNDGHFDDLNNRDFLNAPATIKRTDKDDPLYDDFETIRYGLVDSVEVTRTEARFSCADIFRTLTAPACAIAAVADYPDLPDNSIGKNIPILYGSYDGVELLEVGTNEYLAIDPEYLVSVDAVYDDDGTSISYTVSDGVITATDAATADVTGLADNSIGQIIVAELSEKAGIPYTSAQWDLLESGAYAETSARIDLLVDGGSVRDVVTEALKSDMAFLIQKNDGRLTLRQWGNSFAAHRILPWQLMDVPQRDNSFAKQNFISSAIVDFAQGKESAVYDDDELTIFRELRQKRRGDFETAITERADAAALAERLVDRFGDVPDTIKIKLGTSTQDINPLDQLQLDMTVNGRQIVTDNTFVVIDVDPAQDTLTVESSGFIDYLFSARGGVLCPAPVATMESAAGGEMAGETLAGTGLAELPGTTTGTVISQGILAGDILAETI